MSKWRQVIPNIITVIAMVAGFYSMVMSANGNYLAAAQLIMLSMLLDGIDGNLARLIKGTTDFGAELDTYVDMSSFGLAPALLAYQVVLKDFGLLGTAVATAMVVSGVLRLTRFRIHDPYRGQKGYTGLPITVNACWISMFVFVTESGLLDREWFSLSQGHLATVVWTSSMLFMVLQVSRVRYPKPTKELIGFIPCVLFVILLFLKIQWAVSSAVTICLACFIYAFVTPLVPRHPVVIEDEEEEPVVVPHP
ncbi:MAG: CDP-alcohol phosphatidyltransferase family protein [Verrucomicrobia bacterium]|nr:CDP-alcohol phosphatidyltransferase family protein [Verrucomicrobiota bacterium]